MRATNLFALSVLPILALGQESSLNNLIQSMPFCALGPVTTAAGSSSCGLDAPCLCKDTSFIASLTKSVESACSADDVNKVVLLATKECADNGVTVDIPVEKASNSDDLNGDDSNWGEKARVVDLGMMLGAVGLAGLVGL